LSDDAAIPAKAHGPNVVLESRIERPSPSVDTS
jgi:hypothetical protein